MIQLSTKEIKQTGSHYTPTILSDFVATNIVAEISNNNSPLRILDPAVGDGELLLSLIKQLYLKEIFNFEIFGFDTNISAIKLSIDRIKSIYPEVKLYIERKDFLDFVINNYTSSDSLDLFKTSNLKFDIIITNPPYVRTQVLGATVAQKIASQFDLKGRVDLYHAFIKAYSKVLTNNGIAGMIVSNRFMLTRAGATTRKSILQLFDLLKIWDFGDSKLFEAAVLPAVLLARRNLNKSKINSTYFASIYTNEKAEPEYEAENVIDAIKYNGTVHIKDGRTFTVRQGSLNAGEKTDSVWRLSSDKTDNWLHQVENNTVATFGEIGKVRVGVKTTADKIFIREDWDSLPVDMKPECELLKPLLTHHVAKRFVVPKSQIKKQILYPHILLNGKRNVVNLSKYPKALNYFNSYREKLESRKYVIESGRNWFEIWVPQDPSSWQKPKIVFWDISEKPTFWLDMSGALVNGDCYWFTLNDEVEMDNLWLVLAISNSTFIEEFYDHKFNNKLYAGRRRFMTQYVERFPLPDINSSLAKEIISLTQKLFYNIDENINLKIYEKIDQLVWESFGFNIKKVFG